MIYFYNYFFFNIYYNWDRWASMQKNMIFLEKIFSILSIIFFLITSFFLVINCFEEKIFELSFASLFSFFFFLNQCIFIPGSIKINKREYESKIIHNCQIYTAVVMLVALFVSELYEISDRMSLCIFGNLLLIFFTFYSIQNMFYTYHYRWLLLHAFRIRCKSAAAAGLPSRPIRPRHSGRQPHRLPLPALPLWGIITSPGNSHFPPSVRVRWAFGIRSETLEYPLGQKITDKRRKN